MTFISYAQNYEDVMLRRVFSSVKKGFYVDVGAQHPINDSVTKAFYEEGWSGINIEPIPHWHNLLVEDRTRDINLNVAIGNKPGTLTIYSVAETGLSTADREYAERYRKEGKEVSVLDVPVWTLTHVLDEYATKEIHFLKIDVEGFERQVVEGLNLDRHRPWVLIIESTLPNSTEERFADWESMITGHGYQFTYFDGLNRFYVADEHADLAACLSTPPNVFDGYVRYVEWIWKQEADRHLQYSVQLSGHSFALQERAEKAEQILNETWSRLEKTQVALTAAHTALLGTQEILDETRTTKARLWTELKELDRNIRRDKTWLEQQIERQRVELESVYVSISWRLTKPLRVVRYVIGRSMSWLLLFIRSPVLGVKVAIRKIFRLLASVSVIRRSAAWFIACFPEIKSRMTRFIVGAEAAKDDTSEKNRAPGKFLSESATAFVMLYKAVLKSNERGARQ